MLPHKFLRPCIQLENNKNHTACSVARFLESRGMIEDALEVATDPDYRFELAIQLGKLEIAKVIMFDFFFLLFGSIILFKFLLVKHL